MMKDFVRPEGRLGRDLAELRFYAESRGADDALIIPAAAVVVDPRVRFKCLIPRCYTVGACSHCPPHGFSPRRTREIVSRYHFGIFFRVLVPSAHIAEATFPENYRQNTMDEGGNMLLMGMRFMLALTVVRLVEKEAHDLGYRPTQGFAAGNCRDVFCRFQPNCRKLASGGECRHEGLSIPSMESSGIDAMTMAARAGWDVYPIGGSTRPGDIPHGTYVGLVLVA